MTTAQDILRRGALEYHQRDDRGSSCGSMALDMDLILSGLVEIGRDAKLHVTEKGAALLASAIEAGTTETPQDGSVHESAVPKADAAPQPGDSA